MIEVCSQVARLAFVSLWGAIFLIGPARSSMARPQGTSASPLWTADLAVYGSKELSTSPTSPLANPLGLQNGLFFSDMGALVVYFTTRAQFPDLSIRGQTSQFTLRAVELDGRTGARLSVHDWPARISGTYLVPVAENRFALLSENNTRLYSAAFELLKNIDVPQKERYERQYLKVSPDRTVLWFIRAGLGVKGSLTIVTRMDAASLDELSKMKTELSLPPTFSVSSDFIARSYPQVGTSVVVSDGRTWRILLKATDVWCVGEPLFVSDTQLLVAGCDHVRLLDVQGDVLLDDKIPKPWHVETNSAASKNGRIAAVSLMKTKGGAFDTATQRSDTKIIVYDTIEKRRIYEVQVLPVPGAVYQFALSPDGSSLGVMIGSTVRFYRIPTALEP